MSWLLEGRPIRRALVTRLRYLGDVVMSTVVVEALRRGDPALEIGYLCEEAYAPVLAGHPHLARTHALAVTRRGDDARVRNAAAARAPIGPQSSAYRTLAMTRELRAARYDLAVDLFFNPRSAWLLRLAGIPWRIAGRAGSRGRLYTHRVDAEPAGRQADWDRLAPGGLGHHLARLGPLVHAPSGLDFAAWFVQEGRPARPCLHRPINAGTRAAALREAAGIQPSSPCLLLAPGATWLSKRWPAEHWRALATELGRTWPGTLAVLSPPGAAEQAAALALAFGPGRGAVLPPLPLPAVLDLLADSAGLITVDGGVMHAAVGLGVPTLGLFGPTDPRLWFPYEAAGPFRVLATRPACHPCDRHDCDAFICLPDLRPERVASVAADLFAAPASPAQGTRINDRRAGKAER